ncbi:hypothetical protein [Streptomyces kanamyceticus]|uniref:hypothetical protein n=1 Tax=Streptomyces kanamyceticus TaxID=1967 RepID=UPI0006E2AD04|nr:hypothetical protein [Streptomyces kanamyceticus]
MTTHQAHVPDLVRDFDAALPKILAVRVRDIAGGPNRPPLPGAASRDLFARADLLARDLGMGPLTADGGGAHADHEHVEVAEPPRRTALLTALPRELLQ